jgi:hypothetical protein
MLTLLHPEILAEVLRYSGGIQAFFINEDSVPTFVLKSLHQYLLTAKMNGGFKIYVVPLDVSGRRTMGLMTAFFEDDENPLTIWTTLLNEPATAGLVNALLHEELKIHMFDEHDRELLGYSAKVSMSPEVREVIESAVFYNTSEINAAQLYAAGADWFAKRSSQDDDQAISIILKNSLFSEDLVITDMISGRYDFHGGKGFAQARLVKEEPGLFQEIDIILLLQRVFRPEEIYHAPKRIYDGEEIADVLVITDDICLIVQAKDSPNTEKMLRNTLDRKRKKALKQLKEGAAQVSGAVGYLERVQPLKMMIDGRELEVDLADRNIISLIIVRELFDDSYEEYGQNLFKLLEQIGFPCIALDYPELYRYTWHCRNSREFVEAYFGVFEFARKNGRFPRLNFGMRRAEREGGAGL